MDEIYLFNEVGIFNLSEKPFIQKLLTQCWTQNIIADSTGSFFLIT